jgi:glutaredoxin-related protein
VCTALVMTRLLVPSAVQGSPEEPECGFSQRMVTLLRSEGIPDFGYFDILTGVKGPRRLCCPSAS